MRRQTDSNQRTTAQTRQILIMARVENQKSRKSAPLKSDLHEARPLLQAIFLGMLLATALVAAAAMANPANMHGGPKAEPVAHTAIGSAPAVPGHLGQTSKSVF